MAVPILQLENLTVHLMATGAAQFQQTLNTINRQVGTFASRVNSSFGGMRLFAGLGLAGLTTMMARSTFQFEQVMAQTMSTMEGATDNMQRHMEDVALSLSGETVTNAVKLAEAYREMSKAGLDAAQSSTILAHAERFAFINGMEVGEAAKNIIRMQRAMGTLVNDPIQNAANFEHIGNVITSVATRAGVATDVFMHALSRIGPHLRFLNKDFEEGAAIIAAYSSRGIEAAAAGQMTRMILQNLGRLFIRSETPPNVLRGNSQRGDGVTPSGSFNSGRMFNIHPLHDANNSVRRATDAWRVMGIEVFHTTGALTGQMHSFPHIIRQMDDMVASMGSAQERQRALMRLGFQEEAARSMITLLGSGEAMEQFMLQARNADGLMDQFANRRLQTMNAQFSMLRNNVERAAIEIGRTLIPYMQVANRAVVDFFRFWNELPDAFREVIVVSGALGLSFMLLAAVLPLVIAPLKLLWTMLSLGAGFVLMPLSIFSGIGSAIVMLDAFIFKMVFLPITLKASALAFYSFVSSMAVFRAAIWSTIFVWEAMVAIWSLSMIIAKGVMFAAHAIVVIISGGNLAIIAAIALWTAFSFVMGLVTTASGILASIWSFMGGIVTFLTSATFGQVVGFLMMGAAQLIAKGAAWLLNAAWAAMSTILTYILSITGFIIISFGILVAVMMVAVAVANVAWVGLLFVLQSIITAVGALIGLIVGGLRGQRFADMWDGFLEATNRAFWTTVGFLSNLRENTQLFMTWLDANWNAIIFNMTHFADVAFKNLWENIKIGWAQLILGIMNSLVVLVGFLARMAVLVTNPVVAAIEGPGLLREMRAQAEALGRQAGQRPVALDRGLALRRLTPLPEFNTTVPENVRRRLDEIGRGIRNAIAGEDVTRTPTSGVNQVGSEFKEISLRRFVLDTLDAEPQQRMTVDAPGLEVPLNQILDIVRQVFSGGLPTPPAVSE